MFLGGDLDVTFDKDTSYNGYLDSYSSPMNSGFLSTYSQSNGYFSGYGGIYRETYSIIKLTKKSLEMEYSNTAGKKITIKASRS